MQVINDIEARGKMSSQRMASHGNAPAPAARVVTL